MREKTTPRPLARTAAPAKPATRETSRAAAPRRRFPSLRMPGGGFRGMEGRTRNFIRDTRSELKKVVWPTREEAIRLTMIVTAVSVAIGLVLGAVDYVFQLLFELLLAG